MFYIFGLSITSNHTTPLQTWVIWKKKRKLKRKEDKVNPIILWLHCATGFCLHFNNFNVLRRQNWKISSSRQKGGKTYSDLCNSIMILHVKKCDSWWFLLIKVLKLQGQHICIQILGRVEYSNEGKRSALTSNLFVVNIRLIWIMTNIW